MTEMVACLASIIATCENEGCQLSTLMRDPSDFVGALARRLVMDCQQVATKCYCLAPRFNLNPACGSVLQNGLHQSEDLPTASMDVLAVLRSLGSGRYGKELLCVIGEGHCNVAWFPARDRCCIFAACKLIRF